jgi:hypothetical protein
MANLVALKLEVEELRTAYRNLGAVNMNSFDVEERVKLDVAYKRAENAWLKAEAAYQNALNEHVACVE